MGAVAVHPRAAVGFERAADAYERGRPDYPTEAVAWLRERFAIDRMIARHRGDVPTHRSGRWKSAIVASELFGPLEEHLVSHNQELDRSKLIDRVMSTSVMAALPDDGRRQAVAELEELAAGQ